jgi:hypothetical protein
VSCADRWGFSLGSFGGLYRVGAGSLLEGVIVPNAAAESAVRDYLRGLKDPASLRDNDAIKDLTKRLEQSDDALERLRLRQQLLDAETPDVERLEEAFVTHAKAWADEIPVTVKAFQAEGVPDDVLRRASFTLAGGRRRGAGRGQLPQRATRRSRVTVDEVRAAIPDASFTIKTLQEVSGASPAVVRKVVAEEEAAGRLRSEGTDPEHRGPGRAPVLYQSS